MDVPVDLEIEKKIHKKNNLSQKIPKNEMLKSREMYLGTQISN